jgi:hypothetical protein
VYVPFTSVTPLVAKESRRRFFSGDWAGRVDECTELPEFFFASDKLFEGELAKTTCGTKHEN